MLADCRRTAPVLDLLTVAWFGVIGACIGSFLNVVAYRMPRGMSVVWKPSHCPQCGHDIRARDNLPVLGWLLLRGKCRDCAASISPRYAIVEALMGAAFAWLAYAELLSGAANLPGGPLVAEVGAMNLVWKPRWDFIGLYAYHAGLVSLVMAMVLVDRDGGRVPRTLVVIAAIAVGVGVWKSPAAYPERSRATRVAELQAPVDALTGVAWGMLPLLAGWAVVWRRDRTELAMLLLNAALTLGTIGGFLGLRPTVRITLAWLVAAIAARVFMGGAAWRRNVLAPLWLLVLLHIVFWKHVAPWFNW
jgi:leader peptidase (prepilin peptidase)/N-methyltransferase